MVPNLGNLPDPNINLRELRLIRPSSLLLSLLTRRYLLCFFLLLLPLRLLIRKLLLFGNIHRIQLFFVRQIPCIQDIPHVDLGSHLQIPQIGTNVFQRFRRSIEFFKNGRCSLRQKRQKQMRHGIHCLQRCPHDNLPLPRKLLPLQLPRLLLGQITVDIPTRLHRHICSAFQSQTLHLLDICPSHRIEIQNPLASLVIRTHHIRNHPLAILPTQTRSAMHQIAQRIAQIGVVHIPHALLRKTQLSPIRRLFAQIPSEGIDVESIQHIVGIHHVPNRFGHFLAFFVVDESMGEDGFGERNVGREKDAGPNDGVEPEDVFAYDVDVCRPQFGQFLVAVFGARFAVDSQGIHPGEIIGQRVEPNVHHVILLESLRNANPMLEGCPAHAQIPQPIVPQPGQNRIPVTLRPDELRMALDVLHQSIVIIAHFEKVTRLLHALEGRSRRGVEVVAQLGLGVRDEGLFFDVVPSRVLIEVDIPRRRAFEPEGASGPLVSLGGGPDVIVVRHQYPLVEALESRDVGVADFDGGLALPFGGLGDFFAVFVGAGDEVGGRGGRRAVEAVEAGDGVGGGGFVGVAHVGGAVGVVDGGGDVESFGWGGGAGCGGVGGGGGTGVGIGGEVAVVDG
mmetsp:Transcript_2406/g.4358  ORF Transcript_2406/g.4358 Transcript_2406/m.4358 type:complete len:621 (-) Transcript_2406:186-2048(-)